MFMPPFNYPFIKFTAVGDTVVQGDNSIIIQEQSISVNHTSSSKIIMKSDENRVYLFVPELNSFQLIYDFNAVSGDTIKMFCRDEGQETYIKVKVDSVSKRNINGTELKVQHVSTLQSSENKYQMDGEIIENIGWTGFMFPLHLWADPPYGGSLRCFHNDDFELKLTDVDCDYLAVKDTDFLIKDKTWTFFLGNDGPQVEFNSDMCYKIGGDTIISDTKYKKLLLFQNCDELHYIRGFIRETENGKVYYRENNRNNYDEILLYDFGMEVGDTASISWNHNSYSVLDSISKNSNGQKLYYISENSGFRDKWIENVGSTLGLLKEIITGGSQMFACCLLNEEVLYHNTNFESCYFMGENKTEWAPIGAKWHYTKMEGMMPPNEGYVLYEVTKDTVIQNKTVRKIQKTYYHANGQDTTYLKSDFTYSENGIVYFYGNDSFYQLYNFNAVAGDKWTIYGTDSICSLYNTDSIGTVIVDSVKTVIVNGWPLKAIYTSPDSLSEWYYSEVILERIGCIDHILPRARNCAVDVIHENGSLRCYEDSALGFFTANCCDPSPSFCERLIFYTGIDKNQINYNVFPNPSTDYLYIQNKSGTDEKMQVKLYNVNMQLVYSNSIFANQLSISVLGFQPGLYFVEVSTLTESFCKKIIVQ